jgi:hypothetical protein
MCVYSGAPPFPNRSVFVNIRYVKGHDAGGAAAAAASFYELCRRHIKKTVCIDVERDRCDERILRNCAHET